MKVTTQRTAKPLKFALLCAFAGMVAGVIMIVNDNALGFLVGGASVAFWLGVRFLIWWEHA